MPVLRFVCDICGERFEELVKMGVREGVKCPKCASRQTNRLYEGKCYGAKPGIGIPRGDAECGLRDAPCGELCRGCHDRY